MTFICRYTQLFYTIRISIQTTSLPIPRFLLLHNRLSKHALKHFKYQPANCKQTKSSRIRTRLIFQDGTSAKPRAPKSRANKQTWPIKSENRGRFRTLALHHTAPGTRRPPTRPRDTQRRRQLNSKMGIPEVGRVDSDDRDNKANYNWPFVSRYL